MGAVYFVDKLVECFGHVEGGEDCSMGGGFIETSEYDVIDLM